MQSAKVDCLPKSNGMCPTGVEGEFYTTNNMFSPVHTTWIWHPYPYTAFPGKTWVEVIHEKDPFGDEHFGAWLMYAKGSGVWFNTGKTIAFPEHQDAYKFFALPAGTTHWNQDMSKAAAKAFYDSVQFTAHKDSVEYKACDTQHNPKQAGLQYMNIEIVAVKGVGTYTCLSKNGVPPEIKAGWQGSMPCKCDNTKNTLNCAGVPTAWTSDLVI